MGDSPLLGPLRRRWYIVILGLLVTGFMAFSVSFGAATTYTNTASILLMPGQRTLPPGGNPFQHLADLSQVREVLVQSLSTRTATDSLLDAADAGTGATVTVTSDGETMGPVILLSATAATPQGAAAIVDASREALQARLDSFQDESRTPQPSRISALLVSQDAFAAEGGRQAVRTFIVIAAIGVAATLVLAAVVDKIVGWRKQRARSRDGVDGPHEFATSDITSESAKNERNIAT
jgi:hypothetical protein